MRTALRGLDFHSASEVFSTSAVSHADERHEPLANHFELAYVELQIVIVAFNARLTLPPRPRAGAFVSARR
jgi:hypothetical protein